MKTIQNITFLPAAVGLAILGLLMVSACDTVGDDAGLAIVQYQFEVNMSEALGADASKSSSQAELEFNSGFITIREIVFDGDNETGSVSITHEQVSVIDFATGIPDPPLSSVLIPVGVYESVNLGVELQDVDSSPTLVLDGTYVRSDGASVPIRFEFNSGEVFEANATHVTLVAEREAIAVIIFDPIAWFSVISAARLDGAALENGVLVVSESINADIFSDVADQLDEATQADFR